MFLDTKNYTKDSVDDTVYISSPFPHKNEYYIEGSFSGIGCTSCLRQQFKVVKKGQSLWPTLTQLSY